MPFISVTNSLIQGATVTAGSVNQNFQDVALGTSDGSKDLYVQDAVVNGDLHVGGNVILGNAASDAVSIPGALTVTGSIAGQRFTLSHTYNENVSTVSLDQYVPSLSSNPGYIMHRAGSIIGWSISCLIASFTAGGDFLFRLRKNDVDVFATGTFTVAANGDMFSYTTTQARNTTTFISGDKIQLFFDYTSGTYFVNSILSFVEVYFDT